MSDATNELLLAYALLFKENATLRARVEVLEIAKQDAADIACGAARKAFGLGQTYWQQADSEYISQHRKADETRAKFRALVEETRSAIASKETQ
jgi:hypothetical protein